MANTNDRRFTTKWLACCLSAMVTLAGCAQAALPVSTLAPVPAKPAVTSQPVTAAQPAVVPAALVVPQSSPSNELVINTWGDISVDTADSAYPLHLLIQEWARLHPNVTVTYQPNLGSNANRLTYITTHLRSQTLGDIVMDGFPTLNLNPDLQYDFTADLARPNPYSTNATWKDDFPLNAVALKNVTVGGKTLMVGTTYLGSLGDTAVLYNRDLLDKAGVKDLPRTWDDFYAAQAKLKVAGIQPFFMPMQGNNAYIFTWYMVLLSDQLLRDVVPQCDGVAGDPANNGRISQKEAVYCIKKGIWSAKTPGVAQTFEEMKKWSQYFHNGYLEPARIGSLFLGNVAFYPLMRQEIGLIEHLRTVKFNWGTFYLPALKTGDTARRLGNSGTGQGSQYLFIPKTTADNGKLALALDLLQYISSPQSNAFWCKLQTLPCFKPGMPIEQIVLGDSVKQAHYSGVVDPPAAGNQVSGLDVNHVFGAEIAQQETAILRDYLADNATLDETLAKYQEFLDQQANIAIERHSDWGADKW